MLKISIPRPCHEDWNGMTPHEEGRFCYSCAKTVVDFSGMNDEEIKYFLFTRQEEKLCGRFRSEQIQRITIELPQHIFYMEMPFWKKFLVASLIAFSALLFSCDTRVQGKISVNPKINSNTVGVYKLPNDSGKLSNNFPVPPSKTGEPEGKKCTNEIFGEIEIMEPGMIKGDLSVIETDPPLPAMEDPGVLKIPVPDTIPLNKTIKKNDSLTQPVVPKPGSNNCNTAIYN
jgi:hypothetical protein